MNSIFTPQRKERNRTVSRFTHRGEAFTIHERTNWTSQGYPFTRRFIVRVSDGSWSGEADNVRDARKVMDERAGIKDSGDASKILAEYFPPELDRISEVTDPEEARRIHKSKTADTWGAGPIGKTGYFQLARPSGTGRGKRLVIVCKTELLKS